MIRIVGGQNRGRRLRALKGRKLRPTTERVRESIFDILGDSVRGRSILDIFAGTGAMGIEALSRGAVRAVFIERHKPMARIIRRNLIDNKGFQAVSRVLSCDYSRALRILMAEPGRFDIVFLDPPYLKGLAGESLKELSKSPILSDEAVVVLEHSPREELEDTVGCLKLSDRRRYGDTQVSFYRKG